MKSSSPSAEPHQTSRLRAWVIQLVLMGFALLLALGLVEVMLRSFPELIGMRALSEMDPSLREKIADRLGLPTRNSMIEIPPNRRTDRGPTILMPRPNSALMQYNEKQDIAAGAAQVVHVDENGFCNVPAKAGRDRADILVAGDSFAFCTSVDPTETAAAKMEQISGVPVYNVAIGGVGPDVYLELLKKFAPRFKPKVAVMNIYEGNDLRDILAKREFLTSGRDSRRRGRSGFLAWSYAGQFIIANVRMAIKRVERAATRNQNFNFRYSAPVNGALVAMNVSNKDGDEVGSAMAIRDKKISFDEFRESMTDFVKWGRENNIIPIVSYIPSMYTVYEDSVKFEDPDVGSVVQAFSAAQRKWFADQAEKIGYFYRDMTPAFQAAARQGTLTHFPGNVHLTPSGHEIVAHQLLELIKKTAPPQ